MNQVIFTREEKCRLTANMQRFGGHFIYSLAQAMIAADPENFQRLCTAFPEVTEKYLNWQNY
jgi:hypothetical protein